MKREAFVACDSAAAASDIGVLTAGIKRTDNENSNMLQMFVFVPSRCNDIWTTPKPLQFDAQKRALWKTYGDKCRFHRGETASLEITALCWVRVNPNGTIDRSELKPFRETPAFKTDRDMLMHEWKSGRVQSQLIDNWPTLLATSTSTSTST